MIPRSTVKPKGKRSLRSKILLPFFLVIFLMGLSFIIASTTFFAEFMAKQLVKQYDEKGRFVTDQVLPKLLADASSVTDSDAAALSTSYGVNMAFFLINTTSSTSVNNLEAISYLFGSRPLNISETYQHRLVDLFISSGSLTQNVSIHDVSFQDAPAKVIFRHLEGPYFTATLVPLDQVRTTVFQIIAATLFFISLIGGIIYFIFSIVIRKITASLDILTSVANRVSEGHLNQQVYVDSRDEIGELSQTFNHMVKSLKESAANLLKEKNQSLAIISSIPDGIIVTDLKKRLILANEPAQKMLKFSIDEAIDAPLPKHISNHEVITLLDEILSRKSFPLKRDLSETIDGKEHVYEFTGTIVLDELDERIGVVVVLRDISREREIDELRDSFLRTVSHELRTPLTSIIGFIELVKGQDIADDQRQHLSIAHDEALSLKTLINDLLDLSRIEAGAISIMSSKVNIAELVSNVVSSLHPLAKGKSLNLYSSVDDTSLTFDVDSAKIRRVLVNLITNAIKFTESGFVEVSCSDMSNKTVVWVKDTGVGLPESEKEVIFEKFRQVDFSSTRQYEGIGLGLSIVKQLVELHGGDVWAESVYGEGSTFFFSIPKKRHGNKS